MTSNNRKSRTSEQTEEKTTDLFSQDNATDQASNDKTSNTKAQGISEPALDKAKRVFEGNASIEIGLLKDLIDLINNNNKR